MPRSIPTAGHFSARSGIGSTARQAAGGADLREDSSYRVMALNTTWVARGAATFWHNCHARRPEQAQRSSGNPASQEHLPELHCVCSGLPCSRGELSRFRHRIFRAAGTASFTRQGPTSVPPSRFFVPGTHPDRCRKSFARKGLRAAPRAARCLPRKMLLAHIPPPPVLISLRRDAGLSLPSAKPYHRDHPMYTHVDTVSVAASARGFLFRNFLADGSKPPVSRRTRMIASK